MNHDPLPAATTSANSPLDAGAERRWQQEMKTAIRSVPDLLAALNLNLNDLPSDTPSHRQPAMDDPFPLFVPRSLLGRIQSGQWNDPILRQVLPIAAEAAITPGYSLDPLQEWAQDAAHSSGVRPASPSDPQPTLKKYHGRALLVTTGACAVHCRYCFRRHFPYHSLPQQRTEWTDWLTPIQQDDSLREIILSGGDPLVLNDLSLQRLTEGLRSIPHVRWLRIHSRVPVMIPSRITPSLLQSLAGFDHTTVVLHINHAQELDREVIGAVRVLKEHGCQVLNQAVLLKGVNDSVQALYELSVTLVEAGIQPYYLHQLDPVQGAAHFAVPIQEGKHIMEQLRQRLPGHAIPQYVQEIPGQPYKTPIDHIPQVE